jgi:hypothetical protein
MNPMSSSPISVSSPISLSLSPPSSPPSFNYTLYKFRKCAESVKTKNDYEYLNILDRLFINLFNNISPTESFAKARSECVEKRLDPVKTIDYLKSIYNSYNVQEDVETDIKKYSTQRKLGTTDKTLIDLYEFLVKKYPNVLVEELTKCCLRYYTVGMRGQQWALNTETLSKFPTTTVECFASPFNNYFNEYYSLFEEDKAFGSLGRFSKDVAIVDDRVYYLNPPFTPRILEMIPDTIKTMKKCVVITPNWDDSEWFKKLEEYTDTCTQRVEKYTMLSAEFKPKFTTVVWMKGIVV